MTIAKYAAIILRMDKLRAMQVFVRIIDEGSLTGAARALDTSLPAVVRTLAALEQHLNTRLLNRTTRRIALTEEGRRYVESCRRILADVHESELALSERVVEPSGTLNIAAPVLFGHMYVAPAVTRFVQRYPKVRCQLMMHDRIVNLLEEGVDVGIRIGQLADSTLVAQAVNRVRRVVVASPAYVDRFGVPQHPRQLTGADCVLFSGISGGAWSFVESGREFNVPVQGNLQFNQSASAVEACAHDMGFGMFLSYQVMPYVARGQLRIVLEDYEPPPRPVSVVYPGARYVPARTRMFIEWMRRELATAF